MNEITPEMQAIVEMDRKRDAVSTAVEKQKDKLLKNACAYVRGMTPDNQEAFLQRTVTALLDEKLADCYNTPEGKLSIFRIIEESMQTGLELNKHAYAVPQSKKRGNDWIKVARYDIKRQGFHALLCGGDKPIFRDLRWGSVYEKDKCSIDGQTGEVKHVIAIAKTRGEMIGVWVQGEIILSDNATRKEAEFYPIDYILGVRDAHSESWKSFKAGKISSCPWQSDPVQMAEKTAIKAFSRPWADVKDALAHAIYEEPDSAVPTKEQERPREEVAEAILDAALSAETKDITGKGNEEPTAEPQPEPDIDDEVAALSKDAEDAEGELF